MMMMMPAGSCAVKLVDALVILLFHMFSDTNAPKKIVDVRKVFEMKKSEK